MEIIPVPCLSDNFAYLLISPEKREAAVVDPSESEPVLKALTSNQLTLSCILNTHHHWDHVGGNEELLNAFPGIDIYAHASDRGRVPGQTRFLEEGDAVRFGNQNGWITHNPGHTSGAITYVFGENAFPGDTLFAAGCGRLFEGTPAQMHRSLNQQIGRLPNETRIYFGHEYTENNLSFAKSVESDNPSIDDKLKRIREMRRKGEWSTPSIMAEERQTNPFMRCDAPGIIKTVREQEPGASLDEVSVFGVIRSLKDHF